MSGIKEIYFAGGCFWEMQHFFKQVPGVLATEVGYTNGNTPNPTYQSVTLNDTGYAETVKVKYDPAQLDLGKLIHLFFKTIDPASIAGNRNDGSSQYRKGIYYTDTTLAPLISTKLDELAKQYNLPNSIEALPLKNYYKAEDHHQDYLNNDSGSCHIAEASLEYAAKADPAPKANYVKPDKAMLKTKLTALQYNVTQNGETEMPFENEYNNEYRDGIYVDITTGEPLFVSADKFKSGSGWPSFSKPISEHVIDAILEKSYGMLSTAVKSKTGNAHLGHVFNDGPANKGGLRYCINSASLRFIPKEEMAKEGYATYIALLNR